MLHPKVAGVASTSALGLFLERFPAGWRRILVAQHGVDSMLQLKHFL